MRTVNSKYMRFLVVTMVVMSLFLGGVQKVSAAPATFTVTNTNDSGAGSFRQALIDANGNTNPSDMDVINFTIPGAGVKTITPASAYPIISEKVTINGYSQPGSSANTAPSPEPINSVILIEFDGVDSQLNRLSLNITAAGTVIKGLNMHECRAFDSGSESSCIGVKADDVLIQGNFLGLMPDGQTPIPNSPATTNTMGVRVSSGTGAVIGGSSPEDRNIITNNSNGSQAVSLASSDSIVEGNYIGVARDGVTDLDTVGGVGLTESGGGNRVGGPLPEQSNLISGASQSNIGVMTNGNVVQGNYICTDYTGHANSSLSTDAGGVSVIFNAQENLIGGTGLGEGNVVAGCDGTGIGVTRIIIPNASIDAIPSSNTFLGNAIYSVKEGNFASLSGVKDAILFASTTDGDGDFVPETATIIDFQNDSSDTDTGVNGGMNRPVLNTAIQSGDQITFDYDLDTADSPTNEYRVEFFASDSSEVGNEGGMAQDFLGAVTVSPGLDQSSSITLPGSTSLEGKIFSATATAVDDTLANGFGSTSRVSTPIALTSTSSSQSLADTGENAIILALIGTVTVISAAIYLKIRFSTKSFLA